MNIQFMVRPTGDAPAEEISPAFAKELGKLFAEGSNIRQVQCFLDEVWLQIDGKKQPTANFLPMAEFLSNPPAPKVAGSYQWKSEEQ